MNDEPWLFQYLKKFLPTHTMQLVAALTLCLLTLAKYLPEQIHTVWPHLKAPGMLLSQLLVATSILFVGSFCLLVLSILHIRKLEKDISPCGANNEENICIPSKPKLMLLLLGGNIFIPSEKDVCDRLTGISIDAKIWNIGAKSVTTEWILYVIPEGELPVIAQHTEMPDNLFASGQYNSAIIRSSDSLDIKTKYDPVGISPIEGTILFYAKIKQEVVLAPSTRLELIVKDIFGNETKSSKRIGDWLHR